MANTPYIDLVKPAGTDKALISVLNANSDKIDSAVGGVQDALAIVCNGNTHGAITSGQYVYVRAHETLQEGLYKANSNIAANAALNSTNLTADSSGGLNSLNEQIGTLNSKIAQYVPTKIEINMENNSSRVLSFSDWYAGIIFARTSNTTGYFYALISGYGTGNIRNNNIVLSNNNILTIEYPDGGEKMKITNTLNQSLMVCIVFAFGVPTIS